MATTYPTLANLIKINDANALDLGLSDLLQGAPLVASMYAMGASNGTQHKYLNRTVCRQPCWQRRSCTHLRR
jgi:hypothetical protein